MVGRIEGKKTAGTNVLVSLRSFLLSESLARAIHIDLQDCDTLPAPEINSVVDFKPDLILVDFAGLSKEIFTRWPDGKVLLVDTGLSDDETVYVMRNFRLWGIIEQDADFRQLEKALGVIQEGQIWIENSKLKAILHGANSGRDQVMVDSLSKKEAKIIDLVAEGYKNKEIASMLFLSEQTVKSHLTRIFRKMNIASRSQLVSLAIRSKIQFQNDLL